MTTPLPTAAFALFAAMATPAAEPATPLPPSRPEALPARQEPPYCRQIRRELVATPPDAPLTASIALLISVYLTNGCDPATLAADLGFRPRQ